MKYRAHFAAIGLSLVSSLSGAASAPSAMLHPGCDALSAPDCVALAIQAMGGRAALEGIHSEQLEMIDHTLLTEQSYRQSPFITSYDRGIVSIDFLQGRVARELQSVWPEADPDTAAAQSVSITVATIVSAVSRSGGGDAPAGLAAIDLARTTLDLGPERLLLKAAAAADLKFEAAQSVRSSLHAVVSFRWYGQPVKILLNPFNHLPDAIESTRVFNDFWYAWGDVKQRIYYDNWKIVCGIVYPTNRIEERNGILWSSTQVLGAQANIDLDTQLLAMDDSAANRSVQSTGWNRAFDDRAHLELAPGVDLYQGAWNVTVIQQEDGMLLLEAPISPSFTAGVLAKIRSEHPALPIKAVLSTSDSWPHLAGVREAVADHLAVYILDLNRPLLDQLVSAPHTLTPDHLQHAPANPDWHIVSGKQSIGNGRNRIELYPLRGASTERQFMVYFPAAKLLYASDTLSLDAESHKLYDPELMREVIQAVQREGLEVATVYAMHEAPISWAQVKQMVDNGLSP